KRHHLPSIAVIGEDGRMKPDAGERYAGLDRYECRKKVVEDLRTLGLLEAEKKHAHAVGHCYRCKTIIEPLQTIQWYVRVQSLASEAVRAVEDERIRIVPSSWENNYFAWMKDIRDWCISRQIWWGHQIPVWYCPECADAQGKPASESISVTFFKPLRIAGGAAISGGTYGDLTRLGIGHDEIVRNARFIRVSKDVTPLCSREDLVSCPVCGSSRIIRDPDVLDTWFSSALWPFSTLGWPEETEDLRSFYPTSVLVTGFDILFFWVARMIMMGLKFMGDVPFRHVYIHALVRDAKGHKMSKSKGNVVDPLIMIDKYGADAFRFSLAAFAAQGRDIRFSEDRVEGYRFFINKLWNATRFVLSYGHLRSGGQNDNTAAVSDLPSLWILSRLSATAEAVNRHLGEYRFNEAAGSIYQFIWHEFCDWYIEITKPLLYSEEADKTHVVNCLFSVLEQVLVLLHPFMPFVTEEIYQIVNGQGRSIMTAPFPGDLPRYPEAERMMNAVIEAVSGIRSIRGELNIPPAVEIRADIRALSRDIEEVLRENIVPMMKLTRSSKIAIGREVAKEKGSAVSVKDGMEIYVPIRGLLNVDAEISRLVKERTKIDDALALINRKLFNEDFLNHAPKDVVQKERGRCDELHRKKQKIEENLELLKTVE
ncbi:MAG TPA: class I tRNA ligase family protein, partial [Dissulfurispiraceae bacterium]|nr:class I tRNA ligase family protein [Dissulfurispiraceae bacterium]